MSSTSPNASWHPALMPNAPSDLEKPDLQPPAPIPQQQSSVSKGSIESPSTDDRSQHAFENNVGPDTWFPEYEAGVDTGAEQVIPQQPTTEYTGAPPPEVAPQDETYTVEHPGAPTNQPAPEATPDPVQQAVEKQAGDKVEPTPDSSDEGSPQAATEEGFEEQHSPASENAAKHMSTSSFTRTAHEVNWNDEEDADWNLHRTDTDPFKFMPSNDRTNSFPVVPNVERFQDDVAHSVDHPLPANQVEEIMNEVEREEDSHAKLASAFEDQEEDGLLPDDSQAQADGHRQYMGGDVQGADAEASEARITEGLPLVSHESTAETNGTTKQHDGQETSFAADDDDFFSKLEDTKRAETQGPDPAPAPAQLERKSTMQILGAMDMGQNRKPVFTETLQESPEEDEQPQESNKSVEETPQEEPKEDLDAKWAEVFAEDDDEDFLLDDTAENKEIDTSAFLDDDEGFLEDTDDQPAATPAVPAAPAVPPTTNNRYLPRGQTTGSIPTQSNPYLPSAQPFGAQPSVPSPVPPAQSVAPSLGYGLPPPRPEPSKAQSFVDKAKGGYQSPYDLPMEVVKPKKRVSMQNLQRTPTTPAFPPAPPRSASTHAQAPPPPPGAGSLPAMSPPASSQAAKPPSGAPNPAPPKMFEDLPMVTKVRPASRHSVKSGPSPSQASPFGPPLTGPPQHQMAPPPPPPTQFMPPQAPRQHSVPEIPTLIAPERVNPFAPVQSNSIPIPSVPPATTTRYSPAPPSGSQLNGGVVSPALPSRYSPAPPASRPPSGGYAAVPTGPAPPVLPHLPRTSSPLAHFEISSDRTRPMLANHSSSEAGQFERRGSSTYEQRTPRIPSLPTTQEDEEEDGAAEPRILGRSPLSPPSAPPAVRQNSLPYRPMRTPPPAQLMPHANLSPPKRAASSQSLAQMAASQNFVGPPRSQTQSPGALYGRAAAPRSAEYAPRPASAYGPTSPPAVPAVAPLQPPSPPATRPTARPRGLSKNFNLVPPTDGREHDPLQRWKGSPLVSWGVGGTLVTMFPKDVPRYGMNQPTPMIIRTPGEVKVKNIKDLEPLEERLVKFPGPLKGKGKKKETLAWLSAGIESLEASLPRNLPFQSQVSHEDKRAIERVLLWRMLRIFIEHDGVLEGSPAVEKAVREALSPKAAGQPGSPVLTNGETFASLASGTTQMNADSVDAASIEEMRNYLLEGQREKAVWTAADKRLWGHAMLVANTVSQDLYKQVTREFLKKEVNYPGHNNESLAALYAVLSGNHEECVDELVPAHARAGLQLLAKDSGLGASQDVTEGLDKWQETLTLVLSNRSTDDARAINSLGNLLSSYGRAEAAHICYMFARNNTVFGGLDDPNAHFVLLGSDHQRQPEQFAKEAEPLLLSEVYEYGLSLSGAASAPASSAHLAAYKYQHALTLAEYGYKDKALQYCDAIANAIGSQTRRSPYHHAVLEAVVDDLSKRLKLAPKEESGSWIPKPSMNKVSDSMWNRFNKFVAGDENEGSGQGSPTGGVESGPFARIAGGTPTISRPPSANGVDSFGAGISAYPMGASASNGPVTPVMPPPPTRAGSRYAPGGAASATGNPYDPSTAYAPRSSMERTSSELNRSSFEMSRPSFEAPNSYGNPYAPNSLASSPAQSFHGAGLGLSRQSSYVPVPQAEHVPAPQQLPSAPPAPVYEPYGKAAPAPNVSPYSPTGPAAATSVVSRPDFSAYQPTSYGFEPPSLTPYEASPEARNDEAEKETKEETRQEGNGGYEAPSYQPYGYEPPSYEPDTAPQDEDDSDDEDKPKPKKKGPMYDDDDDDLVVPKSREKTKEEKDRENAEMFRKVAEEEAKRAAEAKAQATKKGWGLGSWFGGKKEQASQDQQAGGNPNKPIRAKLGEKNSFYYDPELKKWVNKNAKPEDAATPKATPPPPRASFNGPPAPRSAASTPPPPMGMGPTSHPSLADGGRASAPPGGPPASRQSSGASATLPPLGPSTLAPPGGAPMMRSASNTSAISAGSASGPPSRPTTSMSNASSIDDLLGAVGPRAKGAAKKKKGGRYVDVMAKP
ncbi:vesicle coat component [Coniochaeta pulveracea]|uniref:Protein transport protein sec16 n=1 Tax=Coniochaeta pulveracea TaxID=177199 RepID=A0A420YE92_9PEZI|nr:vesicle coat component [Coniochaeta pulveracea]